MPSVADDRALEDDLEIGSEVESQKNSSGGESGIVVTVGSTPDLSDFEPSVKGQDESSEADESTTGDITF